MGIWYHYILTEDRQVTLKDIETALRQSSRKFYVDADLIVRKPTEDAEPDYNDENGADLICGQVTFDEYEDGVSEEDEELFYTWAENRQGRDRLIQLFKNARRMVTVQVVNGGGDIDGSEETIAPLWEWLINNRDGVLVAEGGAFYDRSGYIE